MNRVVEATRSLYAALTPEQQKVFDQRSHAGRHGAHPHKG
jgi:Spy/CpxP family protein refolding chaperone